MRGSVCSVAVSGGGHGFPASHVRSERLVVSLARRKLKAVDPVRGSPSPNRGATISCSSISGCRANHCSTSSRFTRRPTIWSVMTLSPSSLSADSLVTRVHQDVEALPPVSHAEIIRSRPRHRGLNELLDLYRHGPRPLPRTRRGNHQALRDRSPRFRIQAGDAPDRLQGDLPTSDRPSTRETGVTGRVLKSCRRSRSASSGGARRFALPLLRPRVQHRQMPSSTPGSGRTVANGAGVR